MVRAKFQVQSIEHLPTSIPTDVLAKVRLHAVYDNGAANREWSKYTPAGNVEMMITNPDAISAFELGKAYFLDFTPAD